MDETGGVEPAMAGSADDLSLPASWPFEGLKPTGYGAIIADPPWSFRLRSEKGHNKSPQSKYGCMSAADLAALPVASLAKPDCALFMWATAPMLPDAVALLKAWGFTYKSAGTWSKRSATGAKWAFGTGYCFRSAAEFYLLGTIGRPRVQSRSIRNLIVAPVREHSRKPDNLHRDVEQLYVGPYAELFGREQRAGWDVWGNQADTFGAAA